MKKAVVAVVAGGMLLASVGAASPALAVAGDTQLCSAGTNGGAMVNGMCVLPALNVGQNAEEFLMNSGGGVDTWTIVSGSIPPGMQMPSVYGAGATIIGGSIAVGKARHASDHGSKASGMFGSSARRLRPGLRPSVVQSTSSIGRRSWV